MLVRVIGAALILFLLNLMQNEMNEVLALFTDMLNVVDAALLSKIKLKAEPSTSVGKQVRHTRVESVCLSSLRNNVHSHLVTAK